jgi:hypothetical protein
MIVKPYFKTGKFEGTIFEDINVFVKNHHITVIINGWSEIKKETIHPGSFRKHYFMTTSWTPMTS